MNKESTGHDFVARRGGRKTAKLFARLVLIAAAGASLATFLQDDPQAQQRFKEPGVKVTGVSTSGNTVSITADGPLSRAQTWQDPDGKFHVVLVNGQIEPGAARGVTAGRVGNSLELVIPVRRGASVTVRPSGNRLDLVVTGGTGDALNVENFPVEQRREERAPRREPEPVREESFDPAPFRAPQPRADAKRRNVADEGGALVLSQGPPPAPAQQAPAPAQGQAPAPEVNAIGPAQDANRPVAAQPAAAAQLDAPNGFDLLSFITTYSWLLLLLVVGLAGAAVMLVRRGRAGEAEVKTESKQAASQSKSGDKESKPFEHFKGDRRQSEVAVPFERRTSGRGAEDEATRRARELAAEGAAGQTAERAAESRQYAGVPAVVFGSYRIDQEVASLVAGGPHSVEVLASRAADDRRAVETSLLKALRAPETDADGRRRARTALEDYGFVARSCAALLLGSETFERVSAARALGDMKSAQALPFLTEALYDPDPVVRTECVQSLGALGLPSAIGALLDVARRHQDLPASVLGPVLTACSVESLELGWESHAAGRSFADAAEASERADGPDSRMIVPVPEGYEELPDSVEDEALSAALVRLESTDPESRAGAAQQLAQFQVRRAVFALASAARDDAEAAVRSAAVTSLGLINHESVFGSVITALADEAREVRAAAARALSRLSFDRADAYVRLVETAAPHALQDVARACVKAGLAAQAVARLTSEDRRQAYEAFSLLSLCVSGGEPQPVIDAVESHQNIDARMTCIQLLGDSRSAAVREQLARLAENVSVPERVRRSICETVERAPRPEAVEVG